MIYHGQNFRGIINKAKEMIFNNTGTDLLSTNAEDAIKEVNSSLSNLTPIIRNGMAYVYLGQSLNPGAEYTVPVDGFYSVFVTGNGTQNGGICIDNDSVILVGTQSTTGIVGTIFLKAGTVIRVRNIAGTSCLIYGYLY